MRDRTHIEQVERWADFVRNNPEKWKPVHTKLINAQIIKARGVIDRLAKTENGKDKIIEAYGIRNKNIYRKLLGSS